MPPPSKVRFDRFQFDPASGELSHDGRRVRLQRQPSRLLELLLTKPGDVVTREEIRLALWGEDTHVDFERSLNFCVARLRSALRDNAAEPRFIETLPTRGYRFIAAVAAEPVSGAPVIVPTKVEVAVAVRPVPPIGLWLRRWPWLAVAGVVAIAAIAFSVWPSRGPASNGSMPKVVVVPFQNETGVPDLDRVAKGVSDATVARLAAPERLPRLKVIGNAADLRFSFRPRDMKAMGDSLGAQYLVLGQMKRDDRRLRIVAHLIRVGDQTHVWAKTYDTEALDLLQQESIAEEIAAAVADTVGKG